MRKLISNSAAKRILEKHTQEQIDNGILTLRISENGGEVEFLLLQKLLEEANEIIFAKDSGEMNDELDDLIEVCKALQGKSDKFSEGWVIENTK